MRIGIDMFGVQSPGSRDRGVGRLGRGLVSRLLPLDRESQFLLYAQEGFPTDTFPTAPNAQVRPLRPEPERGEVQLVQVMDRLVRENPDDLDLLLLLNPFELDAAYGPPARALHGPKLAALVHDVIPFRFQEQYLKPEAYGRRMYRHLERLRRYDLLLANSEATRTDLLDLLALPPERVVTVGAACVPAGLAPAPPGPMSAEDRATLESLGITGPFVFCLGGIDCADRKNWSGLVEAFSLLPPALIASHQLVLACAITDDDRRKVHERGFAQGIGNRFLTPGAVPDSTLRVLYQRCAVFAFPSLYEGFGLPLLEALHCGAPVVAGANSSQPEVVGDAGLLVNSSSSTDIANGIGRLLTDPSLSASLRARGPARAATFTLERMAAAASAALAKLADQARIPNRPSPPPAWRDAAARYEAHPEPLDEWTVRPSLRLDPGPARGPNPSDLHPIPPFLRQDAQPWTRFHPSPADSDLSALKSRTASTTRFQTVEGFPGSAFTSSETTAPLGFQPVHRGQSLTIGVGSPGTAGLTSAADTQTLRTRPLGPRPQVLATERVQPC